MSLQMIGKLLGHKVPATTQRYAHLARDAVAAVNDQFGVAMAAAIDRKARDGAKIIKMRRRARRNRARYAPQAVDALCADGDTDEVASLRVRRALEQGQIRSWGLLIKYNEGDIQVPIKRSNPRIGSISNFSTGRVGSKQPEDGWYKPWRYATRIVLSRDDFNRLFFPHKSFPTGSETSYPT